MDTDVARRLLPNKVSVSAGMTNVMLKQAATNKIGHGDERTQESIECDTEMDSIDT